MRHVVVACRVPCKKLTQPLPTKAGNVLRTIADASNYMLALPDDHAELCARAGGAQPS
jgi:ABC-type nitrate/sulfonate/bicarbonate transport system substrate-binding protein